MGITLKLKALVFSTVLALSLIGTGGTALAEIGVSWEAAPVTPDPVPASPLLQPLGVSWEQV